MLIRLQYKHLKMTCALRQSEVSTLTSFLHEVLSFPRLIFIVTKNLVLSDLPG